jgi:hypothetical protein
VYGSVVYFTRCATRGRDVESQIIAEEPKTEDGRRKTWGVGAVTAMGQWGTGNRNMGPLCSEPLTSPEQGHMRRDAESLHGLPFPSPCAACPCRDTDTHPPIHCARPNQTRRLWPSAPWLFLATAASAVPPPETWDPVARSAREPAAAGPPAGHLVVPGRLVFMTGSTSSRNDGTGCSHFGRTAPAGGRPRRCHARLARHTERERARARDAANPPRHAQNPQFRAIILPRPPIAVPHRNTLGRVVVSPRPKPGGLSVLQSPHFALRLSAAVHNTAPSPLRRGLYARSG